MKRKFAAMLFALTICACADRELQLAPDPAIVPDFPPPPVDLTRPVGQAMLPWLECLSTRPWQQCLGVGSSTTPSPATPTAPK